LPREEAEKLAVEFGVPVDGTLDDLRKRLKEKWRAVEHLPPQGVGASEEGMGVAGSSAGSAGGVHTQVNYLQAKLRGNVTTDMVKNLPLLVDNEPGNVFAFLVKAQEMFDLNLVLDVDFLALLVAKTTGRLAQIVANHMRASST
jgi:hypothetical protein